MSDDPFKTGYLAGHKFGEHHPEDVDEDEIEEHAALRGRFLYTPKTKNQNNIETFVAAFLRGFRAQRNELKQ